MTTMVSFTLKAALINVINRNTINNTNYKVENINTIRFTLNTISIWMNDDNRFDIKYDTINSIKRVIIYG